MKHRRVITKVGEIRQAERRRKSRHARTEES